MSTIRTLIALGEGLAPSAVETALPSGNGIEVVGWIEGAFHG